MIPSSNDTEKEQGVVEKCTEKVDIMILKKYFTYKIMKQQSVKPIKGFGQ